MALGMSGRVHLEVRPVPWMTLSSLRSVAHTRADSPFPAKSTNRKHALVARRRERRSLNESSHGDRFVVLAIVEERQAALLARGS